MACYGNHYRMAHLAMQEKVFGLGAFKRVTMLSTISLIELRCKMEISPPIVGLFRLFCKGMKRLKDDCLSVWLEPGWERIGDVVFPIYGL